MTQIQRALLLASAMIGTAVLARAGVLPANFGSWATLALLALFPSVWLVWSGSCGASR